MNEALRPPPLKKGGDPTLAAGRRLWQGIPGIERAANGRLWATWYSGGADEGSQNHVVLATSDDDGVTWSDPVLVVDPPGLVRAFDPCLWHDPLGRMWLFWAQSYCWWDGRAGVWSVTTQESGQSHPQWSQPRRLCDGVMMNKPTVLANGVWLLPAAVWERPAHRRADGDDADFALHVHDLKEMKGAHAVASKDQGETWTSIGKARVPDRVFDEHMIVERRDGLLWMLVRTSYGIGETFSCDGGKTWSEGRPSRLRNADARFFIRRLLSGNLLLVHHDPPGTKTMVPGRTHLTAHLSDDDGRTWIGGLLLDERADVSYPDGVQAPDGRIYIIYDRSRTVEKEILMAVFREEDIRAGQLVSADARLRVLVSKAGE